MWLHVYDPSISRHIIFHNESYSVELLIYCAIWINRHNCKMDIEGTTISKGEEKKKSHEN